jgi:DNA-binding NarL/FixJ family response regulator
MEVRDDGVGLPEGLVNGGVGLKNMWQRALRAGAKGYINNETAIDCMMEALRKLRSGSIYLSRAMTDRLLQSIASGDLADGNAPLEQLSDRELEVSELIGQGMTTRSVAEHLGISVKTVETYRENIKNKLSLENNKSVVRPGSGSRCDRMGDRDSSATTGR